MKYLLNINSRTVHYTGSTDGRCKIKNIREENSLIFDDKEEAINYLPKGNKPTKLCSFCFPNSK